MATLPGPRHRRLLAATAMPLLALALLAGCSSSRTEITGSLGPSATDKAAADARQEEIRKATEYWGARYEKDRTDRVAGLNYARNLRAMTMNAQAVQVLAALAQHHRGDRAIMAEYGRALAEAGAHEQALGAFQQAIDPARPDWRLLSAKGVALDQMGRHGEAQERYLDAHKLAPREPAVLNNLGLSYALSRDLARAEDALRRAVALPGADAQVKENLALVLGLQGKFSESQSIASAAMPPEQAEANTAYLRQMTRQQASWEELSKLD